MRSYSLAGSQCSTHHFEHAILTQTNNSTSILNSMVNNYHYNNPILSYYYQSTVLKSIESKLEQFSASTCTDLVIHDAILKLTNRILQNCQNHFDSCKEASQKLASEALLSESTAKSLLALVLHRPLLHEIDTVIYPDISSLLKTNT